MRLMAFSSLIVMSTENLELKYEQKSHPSDIMSCAHHTASCVLTTS